MADYDPLTYTHSDDGPIDEARIARIKALEADNQRLREIDADWRDGLWKLRGQVKQLEALLRELAEADPTYGSEIDSSACCLFCDGPHEGEYDYSLGKWVERPTLEKHQPACLWRRACEALGIDPDKEA